MRDPYPVRFEWGPAGAAAAAPSSSYLVIVDVLADGAFRAAGAL